MKRNLKRPDPPGPSPTLERRAWSDIAKGGCILLVVAFHAGVMLQTRGRAVDGLYGLQETLGYALMPLFFFCSGLWSKTAPWPVLIRRRLGPLLYAFLLWTAIRWTLQPWAGDMLTDPPGPLWGHLIDAFVRPDGDLWFLWALLIYTVLAKLLEGCPTPLATALAAVPAYLVLSRAIPLPSFAYHHLAENFVTFVLAARLREPLIAHLGQARWPLTVVLTLAFVGAAGLAYVSAGFAKGGFASLATLLGVWGGLRAAQGLSTTAVGPPLAWLGKLTLPIYLTHVLVLWALIALTGGLTPVPGVAAALILSAPTAALGAAIAVLAPRLGLGALFVAPIPRALARPAPAWR